MNKTKNKNHIESNEVKSPFSKLKILDWKVILFLVISIVIFVFFLYRLDLNKIITIISNARPEFVLLAISAYFISNFFKALRFSVLVKEYNITFFRLYTITSLHNFFNMILPARTGEFTLLYYLKTIGNTNISKGLHSLVVARIFDFIIVGVFFVSSSVIFFGSKVSYLLPIFGIIAIILAFIILLNIKYFMRLFQKLFEYSTIIFKLEKNKYIIKIQNKLIELIDEFTNFNTKKHIPLLTLYSFGAWLSLYTLYYISIRALNIPIQYIQSISGATGAILTFILPINSFGSMGTLEAGWVGGYMLVGMSEQNAIISGFGFHVIALIASTSIALIFYLLYIFISKK